MSDHLTVADLRQAMAAMSQPTRTVWIMSPRNYEHVRLVHPVPDATCRKCAVAWAGAYPVQEPVR